MMQSSAIELRFRYSQANAAEIQMVADEVLDELHDEDSEAARQARKAGLDPSILANADINVREQGQGVEPILTTILVSISAEVGAHIARRFWDEVLWPRLRRRFGANAVGEELDGAE